jgi:hypothetical protein
MLVVWVSFCHRSRSAFSQAVKCAGVLPTGSAPQLTIFSFTPASFNVFTNASFSHHDLPRVL